MEQRSFSPLKFRHISSATNEIIEYIRERSVGNAISLKTRWKKFNNVCMGGIEPNTIYTIAGISGSGKSSFVNSLETDMFDLNPDIDFCVLSFTFEMPSSKQVGRKLSAKMNRTTQELYSGLQDVKITDDDIERAEEYAKQIRKYEVYYVDNPGNVDEIQGTIEYFQQNIAKDRWLVVFLDHTLLTKGRTGQSEREILSDLQKMLMQCRKCTTAKTTILQLSQMNRSIEDKDRISNQTLHYPMRSDIFGGDSVFQASDYVMVLHRPELLLGENNAYGPKPLPVKNRVYIHVLKNREGNLAILAFQNNLKYNRIEDIPDSAPENAAPKQQQQSTNSLF